MLTNQFQVFDQHLHYQLIMEAIDVHVQHLNENYDIIFLKYFQKVFMDGFNHVLENK